MLIGALLVAGMASAQPSPFNGLVPQGPDRPAGEAGSNGTWRVLIGGHLHGASDNRSGYPATSLLASLDTLNAIEAHLFLSTGDLFLDSEDDIPRYEHALFQRLTMPLYNVPGNHDTGMRSYTERYGPTYGTLDLDHTRVVLLDTEMDNGSLRGPQLDLLRAAAEEANVRQVLILSHRPIWAEDDERYSPLFKGNTRAIMGTNYRREVLPLLEGIAANKPVYWISGSVAGLAPASIFFQPHAPNLTFIQCAIRDEPRDALLVADIAPGGITWSALSLTGADMLPVEDYDAEWWAANMRQREPFNWRLLPYLAWKTVSHRSFYWGLAAGAILLLLLHRLFRRRR